MLKFNEFSNERSGVETAPAPVKPKEKEKERTKIPDKNPSINQFRRTPDVKPGEEPNPKATTKNSTLNEGKMDSKGRMAYATFKETKDKVGYNVNVSFEGSVRKVELPSDWKEQLQKALNESEEILMEKLPWLQ